MLDENLWKTPLAQIEKTYLVKRSPEQLRMMALQREMLKRRGFDPGEIRDHAFVWLSAQHDGLLAEAGAVPLWGEKVGEIVMRGTEGNVSSINISLYNRGDDGTLKVAELQSRFEQWKVLLDAKTGIRGEARKSTSAVEVTAFQWRKGDTAILLESSVATNEGQQRAEFCVSAWPRLARRMERSRDARL